jgi:hypothetical protein
MAIEEVWPDPEASVAAFVGWGLYWEAEADEASQHARLSCKLKFWELDIVEWTIKKFGGAQ